jgi:hypothetical protein
MFMLYFQVVRLLCLVTAEKLNGQINNDVLYRNKLSGHIPKRPAYRLLLQSYIGRITAGLFTMMIVVHA